MYVSELRVVRGAVDFRARPLYAITDGRPLKCELKACDTVEKMYEYIEFMQSGGSFWSKAASVDILLLAVRVDIGDHYQWQFTVVPLRQFGLTPLENPVGYPLPKHIPFPRRPLPDSLAFELLHKSHVHFPSLERLADAFGPPCLTVPELWRVLTGLWSMIHFEPSIRDVPRKTYGFRPRN